MIQSTFQGRLSSCGSGVTEKPRKPTWRSWAWTSSAVVNSIVGEGFCREARAEQRKGHDARAAAQVQQGIDPLQVKHIGQVFGQRTMNLLQPAGELGRVGGIFLESLEVVRRRLNRCWPRGPLITFYAFFILRRHPLYLFCTATVNCSTGANGVERLSLKYQTSASGPIAGDCRPAYPLFC
jgi:hypothetical protein